MNRKAINRSTERVLEEKNINPRISCERKCQTPSVANQQKKSSTFEIKGRIERERSERREKDTKQREEY